MIETVIRDRRSSLIGEKTMSHFPFRGSPNIQVGFFFSLISFNRLKKNGKKRTN